MISSTLEPIWPHFIAPQEVGREGLSLRLKADRDVRIAVARLGDLLSVDSLQARLRIDRDDHSGCFRLLGTWRTHLVYRSVRALKPVPASLTGRIDERAGYGATEEWGGTIDPFSPDPPLEIGARGIAVGDLVVELMMTELDPYPHGEDEEPIDYREEEPTSEKAWSQTFGGLARWRAGGDER